MKKDKFVSNPDGSFSLESECVCPSCKQNFELYKSVKMLKIAVDAYIKNVVNGGKNG